MRIVLSAVAVLAMSAGAAMAGEGRGDAFGLHLNGFLGTYVVGAPTPRSAPVAAQAPAAAPSGDTRIILMPAQSLAPHAAIRTRAG